MTTAVVTGANRGIGFEIVKQLAARGVEVVAACRSTSPELDALAASGSVRVQASVDVTSDASVAALAASLGPAPIDLVVLNAGILLRGDTADAPDFDGIRQQLEVNAIGSLRVAAALVPRLARGAKIGVVTSRMGSIADNTSGGYYGYRMSKAALNIAAVSLARDLAPRGVSVAILHPGYVKTGMTRGTGSVEPADAARDLLARIDALRPETSGTFWHANGERLPW